MASDLILFYAFGAIAVAATLLVIAQSNPIYSVLLLIASFMALAGLYVLLDAPFVAVTQIIVYAGAIMVLFLFVVMLLNAPREDALEASGSTEESTGARALGLVLAMAMAIELVWALNRTRILGFAFPEGRGGTSWSVAELGRILFGNYAFAFEATSILILIAMVGAITLAGRHLTDKKRIPNPDPRIPSPESRIPSPESRIPSPESRIPDPESRVPVPYPIDDAALHHVFDGGWMWVLRFGNGVTSAGVAVEDRLADELKLAEGEPAWRRLLARYPSIANQFADARPIRAFTWMPRMAYRAAECVGDRWAMLPSAAAFIDPLFSTGIPLTLLGIERLAGAFGQAGLAPQAGLKTRLYGDATLADADRTARFIAGSYAGFRDFPMFASYSMFYFAAASFSEMARRLDSPRTPRGFLCGDSDRFSSAMTRLSPVATGDVEHDRYERDVATAIADWNVAGLCDPDKRNWYGVDLDDTIRGADKLRLTRNQVRERLGLVACPS